MPTADELKALLARVPDPDGGGTYANLDADRIAALRGLVAELLKGGRDAVLALIDRLVEPGQGDDLKPHVALHLLAVHVTGLGEERARADFALALASEVGGNRPKGVQKYLLQELALAGGPEVAPAIGRALLDPELCDDAARALAALRGSAADVLLAALPRVQGRGRLSLVKKLAVLRCAKAADVFRRALADADPDVRIAAAWGLARLADASDADSLFKAADACRDWERINLTDAFFALADALLAAGRKAEAAAIYSRLHETRTARGERHVRDAAARALAAAR